MLKTSATSDTLDTVLEKAWTLIAPYWPLKNFISVNPGLGFENENFDQALETMASYFQKPDIPVPLYDINRISMKWLSHFFDEGQSSVEMPLKNHGFLKILLQLILFDRQIKNHNKETFINELPENSKTIIESCLDFLEITKNDRQLFINLALTTLPGWAGYVQYYTSWNGNAVNTITKEDYLAFRLILICLMWPKAKDLLEWHRNSKKETDNKDFLKEIEKNETAYLNKLIKNLGSQNFKKEKEKVKAQFVFCIDVRSEPIRRAIERQGDYKTYGFAGFFGVPVSIENHITGEEYNSCPVLLLPAHKVVEYPHITNKTIVRKYYFAKRLKKLYQSTKYNFATPFALAETVGIVTGFLMFINSVFPTLGHLIRSKFKGVLQPIYDVYPSIKNIPVKTQIKYAENALNTMGMVKNFPPLVFLCAHGSTTTNNAFATSLDCGACGGNEGSANAKILAMILNNSQVRAALKTKGITIPKETCFVAAKHNTTTDEITLYNQDVCSSVSNQIKAVKKDLETARAENSLWRCHKMNVTESLETSAHHTSLRSLDWAQVRAEWGLSNNAAFIIAPRFLTKNIDLDGRCFLHSYEHDQDKDGTVLEAILTAPMVVAYWINSQYLFSTLDNTAYGAGSKITKNIVGKMGVVQGNASDLMTGLPFQSVYLSDDKRYHEPMRLTTLVYGDKDKISQIIKKHKLLMNLFKNNWVNLVCMDPKSGLFYKLKDTLDWVKY